MLFKLKQKKDCYGTAEQLIQFCNFFRYYEDLPHPRLAVAELWKLMPVSLLEEDADWIQTWRDPAIDEEPEVPVVLPGKRA